MPDTLHDELQVRSLDRVARPAFGRRDLVEHSVDELGLRATRAAVLCERRVALEGSDDRGARGVAAQAVESERVAEEPRDAALEPIQARKLVLSEADEKTDPQARLAQSPRELLEEASCAVFGLVVEQVLVELVEHDVEVAFERERPGRERAGQRVRSAGGICDVLAGDSCELSANTVQNGLHRVVAPGVDDRDRKIRDTAVRTTASRLTEVVRDPGAKHGCLACPARPVQDRERRGHEVRGNHLALALAAEKEERVELVVSERREAAVRTVRPLRLAARRHAHGSSAVSSSAAVRPSTSRYWWRGASRTSTPRESQYCRSTWSGWASTAHER